MFQHTFYYKTVINRPLEEVWEFFQSNDNLAAITGFPKIEVLGDKHVFEGAEVHLKLNFLLISLTWKGRIAEMTENKYFIDIGEQLPFPFKSWRHLHTFKPVSQNETMMIDQVKCDSYLPAPVLNIMLTGMFTDRKKQLYKRFGH